MNKRLHQIWHQKDYRETAWAFFSKATSFVLFFFFYIFSARILGAEKFGEWAFLFSLVTVFSLFADAGINPAIKKFIAEKKETPEFCSFFWTGLFMRLAVSIFFSVVLIGIFPIALKILDRQSLEPFVFLVVLLVFFLTLGEFWKNIFQGLHTIRELFLVTFFEFLVRVSFVILFFLIFRELSVASLFLANIFAFLSAIFIGAFLFFWKNKIKKILFFDISVAAKIGKYALPLLFTSFGFLAFTEIDTLMLAKFSGDVVVGNYAAAKYPILKFAHIGIAIAIGTTPIFAKSKSKSFLRRKMIKILTITAAIFGVLSIFIFVFAPILFPIFFGNEFLGAILPFQILSIYLFFVGISAVLNGILDFSGRAKKRAAHLMVALFMNIALNFYLIPKYGAVGAAMATLISYFPYFALNFYEVLIVTSDTHRSPKKSL